jgi:hypothetical protein
MSRRDSLLLRGARLRKRGTVRLHLSAPRSCRVGERGRVTEAAQRNFSRTKSRLNQQKVTLFLALGKVPILMFWIAQNCFRAKRQFRRIGGPIFMVWSRHIGWLANGGCEGMILMLFCGLHNAIRGYCTCHRNSRVTGIRVLCWYAEFNIRLKCGLALAKAD